MLGGVDPIIQDEFCVPNVGCTSTTLDCKFKKAGADCIICTAGGANDYCVYRKDFSCQTLGQVVACGNTKRGTCNGGNPNTCIPVEEVLDACSRHPCIP